MRLTGKRPSETGPKEAPPQKLSQDAIERRIEIGRQRNIVMAYGCGSCYNTILLTPPGGERLLCARLKARDFGIYDGEGVAACGVPELYDKAQAGALPGITEGCVIAARPNPKGD